MLMEFNVNNTKILIVDDIEDNLLVLENVLKKLNVKIIKAHSGNEALASTFDHDFSLIILDVMMPGMNGYETAELLKSDTKTAKIPIIFLTAQEQNEAMELKAYSKGAIDFLYKPLNTTILISKVKILLDLYLMKQDIENIMIRQLTQKPKILIVDDISENLLVLNKLLKRLDVEVIKAKSGNEALSQTLYHDFALIILDVQMPEMDGYEVADFLKSDEKTVNIPIIFVTAIDRNDTKEIRGYDKGAIDFIFKPFNEFILISKVKIFLEMYEIRIGLENLIIDRTKNLREINNKLEIEVIKNRIATKKLIAAKSNLNSLINSIPSILVAFDNTGRITSMNLEAENFTEKSAKEAIGKTVNDIFPLYQKYIPNIQEIINQKKQINFEKIKIIINNETQFFSLAIFPLIQENAKGAVMRINNITEKIKLEEMLVQSEKMLSVGGLAAGMAHEINNPLAGIIQNTQVLKKRISEESPKNLEIAKEEGISFKAMSNYMEKRGIFKMIDFIMLSGERAAMIVENMLSFARKSESDITPLSLPELMDKTLDMASTDYDLKKKYDFKQIKIIKEYQKNLPLLNCESSKIQQVLLNVLKNGAHAMADFHQKNKNKQQKNPSFTIRIKKDNKFARIEIEDNGPGMDEKTQKRIFEPFFTTKEIGTGTGLGLSISYFIITEDHEGKMMAESEIGKGSKFIIELPFDRTNK